MERPEKEFRNVIKENLMRMRGVENFLQELLKNVPDEGSAAVVRKNLIEAYELDASVEDLLESESGKLLLRFWMNSPVCEEEIKELYSVLCHKDLSYCCSAKKDCMMQNLVRAVLEMSDEDYTKKKEEFGMRIGLESIANQ